MQIVGFASLLLKLIFTKEYKKVLEVLNDMRVSKLFLFLNIPLKPAILVFSI